MGIDPLYREYILLFYIEKKSIVLYRERIILLSYMLYKSSFLCLQR
jgi:hypothetical protein